MTVPIRSASSCETHSHPVTTNSDHSVGSSSCLFVSDFYSTVPMCDKCFEVVQFSSRLVSVSPPTTVDSSTHPTSYHGQREGWRKYFNFQLASATTFSDSAVGWIRSTKITQVIVVASEDRNNQLSSRTRRALPTVFFVSNGHIIQFFYPSVYVEGYVGNIDAIHMHQVTTTVSC